MHNIPRLFRFILIATGIHLLIFLILRFGLYWYFKLPADPISSAELIHAFYLGLKFDLRLSLMMTLPLFIFGGIRFLSPFEYDSTRRLWLFIQASIFTFILFIYFINFAHFSYLHKPIDASAIRFLHNFSISMEMAWSSYPIVRLSLLLLAITATYVYTLNKIINYFSDTLVPMYTRKRKILFGTISTLIIIFGLYGKVSYYPLRWSDAFFSTHNFAPTVAMNPILYFLNTLKNRDISFDINKVKKYYPEVAAYLGVKKPNIDTLNFARHITPEKRFKHPPNIVIVIMESFSSYKTGIFGNPLNPTPTIDALANNGIYFNNFYTPSTGTARSVWTAVTGIPDIETNKTSTRNPLIVDQHTLINAFQDYEKLYFIGGSASWGNIRGLLSSNIPGLKLYEEDKYTSPRMDVWGISDLHLFEEAHNILKIQDKPFFAIVQTSGNHRPYNIPEDNRNFIEKKITKKEAQDYGFLNSKEYNAFRFMDHSIGYFIKEAKKEKYFDNTIFVFFGDHGVTGTGKHMTPAQRQLHINALNVPLVLYAPKLLKSEKHSIPASEVDVLPTLVSLAGFPYTNTTLGSDLLNPNINKNRYVFTMEHRKPLLIAVTGKNDTFTANFDGSQSSLHNLNSQTPRDDMSQQKPNEAKKLKNLVFGLYETIKYMRYHNKPK
ncbi:MAG: sulfatase-like hydrolase/transferase [Gammaproteobacteria bacterium]|nr:sulfatase-like hydrolase/transferase [Gammaproteobacteria bacterium]MDH5660366.1 sulfatase-like hydrolase/transferase [Gammaproteobacteria bacterium]